MEPKQVGYRCIVDQVVLPSVEEWRSHAAAAHGPKIFEAAGYGADPPPEEMADPLSDEAREGVRLILLGQHLAGRDFHPAVWTAIRAQLAVDADPYWMMSDDGSVRPKAALTEGTLEAVRALGWWIKCADHKDFGGSCSREVPALHIGGPLHGRCSGCLALSGTEGIPGHGAARDGLCAMCHTSVVRRTEPGYVRPRLDHFGRPSSRTW